MGRKRKAGNAEAPQEAAAEPAKPQGPVFAVTYDSWSTLGVHPDVVDLCDHFHIDDHLTKKLHETLAKRPDTFEDDLNRIWSDMSDARSPQAVLNALMKQMVAGSFVGQATAEKEMNRIIKKFKLDPEATKRIIEAIGRQTPEMRQKYYPEIEAHLEACGNPSAHAMSLLKKIKAGESLGPVTGKRRHGDDDRKDDRGRGGDDRDRDRDSGRQRDDRDYRDYKENKYSRDGDRDGGGDRRRDYERDRDRGRDSYDRGSNQDAGKDGGYGRDYRDDRGRGGSYESGSAQSYGGGSRDSEQDRGYSRDNRNDQRDQGRSYDSGSSQGYGGGYGQQDRGYGRDSQQGYGQDYNRSGGSGWGSEQNSSNGFGW